MSQKLPVNGFKWVKKLPKFVERFIKNYYENSDKGYPKYLFNGVALSGAALNGIALNLHMDLPFLPERNKIKKFNKLVCNISDKKSYVVFIRALKQALNQGVILKKVHRVIPFNLEAWFEPYIDMNTKLKTEAKNDFEKEFFRLKNNAVFGKTMKNVRKQRHIKLVTKDKRRNQLTSESNYHTTKSFS